MEVARVVKVATGPRHCSKPEKKNMAAPTPTKTPVPPTQEELDTKTSNGNILTATIVIFAIVIGMWYWPRVTAYLEHSAAVAARNQAVAEDTSPNLSSSPYVVTVYPRMGSVIINDQTFSQVIEVTAQERGKITLPDEAVTVVVSDHITEWVGDDHSTRDELYQVSPRMVIKLRHGMKHEVRLKISKGIGVQVSRAMVTFTIDQVPAR